MTMDEFETAVISAIARQGRPMLAHELSCVGLTARSVANKLRLMCDQKVLTKTCDLTDRRNGRWLYDINKEKKIDGVKKVTLTDVRHWQWGYSKSVPGLFGYESALANLDT